MTGTHLTADDHKRLSAALAEAATHTCARFELVSVHVSDRYALFPLVYGAVAGLTALGAQALFWPALPLRTGFFVAVVVFAAVAFLLDWLPLRLLSVPRRIKHAHARDMAHRAFAARVLAQPDRKPGVVFFVSLGERYVEIVTDRDVHQRVLQPAWDAIVADFARAAKERRVADGLLAATDACTKVLAEHYPAT